MGQPQTLGVIRYPREIVYAGLTSLDFPVVVLAASQTNATVQALMPIIGNFKCMAISCALSGTIAGTVTGINVVAGTAAEAGVPTQPAGYPDTNMILTAGQQIFAADAGQALTMTANLVQNFFPVNPNFDAYFTPAQPPTLRITTAAATTGNLYVVMYGKFDGLQTPGSQSTAVFNPANL